MSKPSTTMQRRNSFSVLFYFCVLLMALGCGSICYLMHHQILDVSVLEHADTVIPTRVLDDEGNELIRFQLDRRDPVMYEQLPRHLIDAFVAAEDWKFFTHHGISWKGIFRSVWVNVTSGRCAQGASTITQQLVKLLFFDSRKTFSRKLKEQCCAVLLEQYYSKSQILEAYLNNVCFGCGIYGVQAASQRFWGRDVSDISLDQAALLAGIVRSPGRYCPLMYPLSATRIRNLVLQSMCTLGVITAEQRAQAAQRPLNLVAGYDQEKIAPHFIQMLRTTLEKQLGKRALYTDGFVVHTTLNRAMQRAAGDVFYTECCKLQKTIGPDIDGGLISIAGDTGEIKALIGGFNFEHSQYNRVTQARRQIGSIIKPMLYAAALNQGLTFTDVEIDEPTVFGSESDPWAPHNYDHQFRGPMTRAYALSHSNNIVAIKTLLATGASHLVELLKVAGISGPLHTYPSIALGCIDASLLEVVGMSNIFAHNGLYVTPHYIRWIKNRWGQKVYAASTHVPAPRRVLTSSVSDQVAKVLELGLQRIQHAFADRWPECQMISKTGTTNDARTCWFVGSTPSYTTAVYIGFDDNRPMGPRVFPIHTAFPIWLSYNYVVGSPKKQFLYDPSLRELLIDERTGHQVWTDTVPGTISIFA